jgi:hypothetical protein
MTGRPRKLPSAATARKRTLAEKQHENELLDEALRETFPASDPPAMIQPAPDRAQADGDGKE